MVESAGAAATSRATRDVVFAENLGGAAVLAGCSSETQQRAVAAFSRAMIDVLRSLHEIRRRSKLDYDRARSCYSVQTRPGRVQMLHRCDGKKCRQLEQPQPRTLHSLVHHCRRALLLGMCRALRRQVVTLGLRPTLSVTHSSYSASSAVRGVSRQILLFNNWERV